MFGFDARNMQIGKCFLKKQKAFQKNTLKIKVFFWKNKCLSDKRLSVFLENVELKLFFILDTRFSYLG